mmetsp:Transcript_5363/g.10254  ORF Transcript_5363/g.10254 Transcript_5363/m.10254 type:complete len:161 (-) Transcript_5363:198-680(-)|eukprot:CAMPEP_0167791394 /NCGR_PEP_ID=MMETSP0111_2-20121227/11919_1 /TAXON_ID=91324 /ORGANISM="Lotharella globosa, Strain CCCM811" /LENGTH=160 /DNA_ID=CAMNT_0007684073 /DNA_START=39 /DNA_END=521 /DNA_ORIENTATION=+
MNLMKRFTKADHSRYDKVSNDSRGLINDNTKKKPQAQQILIAPRRAFWAGAFFSSTPKVWMEVKFQDVGKAYEWSVDIDEIGRDNVRVTLLGNELVFRAILEEKSQYTQRIYSLEQTFELPDDIHQDPKIPAVATVRGDKLRIRIDKQKFMQKRSSKYKF